MKTEVFVEKLLNSNEPIENIVIDYIEERNPDFQRELEYIKLPGLEMPVIRIGLLELDDSATLHFYSVKMDGAITERSSKKRQFEIAKKILSNQFADAGIFFFHDENRNFRISFVYKQYVGTKEKYSHYKRYTFFLSKERPFKTFITQLKDVTWKNLKEIKEAFSVQPLTKQFYKELQAWYFYAMDKIKFPEDYKFSDNPQQDKEIRNATNLIRLLTRLIFVWFLKEKELIPEKLFDESQLKHIVKDFLVNEESRNYYNAILQNLFFATLNQRQKDRAFASEGGKPYNPHYGVKTLYRYADKFLISKEEVLELFRDIPFLNGGLFDCLDKEDPENNNKVVYIDGFSRNPSKQAIIPDFLFFNDKEITADLSAYGLSKNEKVRGLFNIFRDYNWTTDEASPIDEEIALDPELLGKVFENLLASYNPETSASARKATGSYYTPREIVDFMVEESLVEYLKDKVPEIEEERIRLLISYSDEIPEFSEDEKEKLLQAIDEIKILDPACGSGAFPMGILHKLVHIIERLDPENIHWRELQRKKIREEIVQVFEDQEITDEEIKSALKELQEVFDESLNYPDYARKLYIIENSIYGVDIQPIAVQISKLRFFISLILDQKIDKTKENFGIRPLPNLETKFVAANTLIGLEKGTQISLGESVIHQDAEELRRLRHRYFTAKTRRQKVELQDKDKKLREKIKNDLISVGFPSESAEKIASFDPFDPNASADWFDPEWMFGIKDGFDIVIGNPPHGSDIARFKGYIKKNYKYSEERQNSASLFIELSFKILKRDGILSFIIPKSISYVQGWEKPRNLCVFENTLLVILDISKAFENVKLEQVIIICKKNISPTTYTYRAGDYWKDKISVSREISVSYVQTLGIISVYLTQSRLSVFNKIMTGSVPLGSISKTFRGLPLQSYISENGNIPVLRGKNICKYGISGKIDKVLIDDNLMKSRKFQNLKQKKIVSQNIVAHVMNPNDRIVIMAYLDHEGYITLDTVMNTVLLEKHYSYEYVLAILNSRLAEWFYYWFVYNRAIRTMHFDEAYIGKLPIKIINDKNMNVVSAIEERVRAILQIKNASDEATSYVIEKKEKLEKEINELVYTLYQLTNEEIQIIEQIGAEEEEN